ncbi:hypothetical protein HMN09_00666100 [Mycena chlorophos]|uniref:Uncharacterized protein n=1 Tax=Mycena chlorophos TaxID=658473 RepID=A0A8H6SZJ2_MYCCL|nr:hypothetical protein HMN09_00666100 [Mycena chlorophos]
MPILGSKFKAPSLPSVPSLPSMPSLPKAPSLPKVPTLPGLPTLPSPHISLPSPPTLPSLPSVSRLSSMASESTDSIVKAIIEARAQMLRNLPRMPGSPESVDDVAAAEEEEEEKKEEELSPLEPVYIVLRPLALAEAPQAYLKRLGRVVKAIEFENYVALQHWGVLIGDRYYHLHIDDATQQICVSMAPFVHEQHHERHTIKFPIWRTRLTHEERVGVAVGIIKAMGGYKTEEEVQIWDEDGKLVLPDSEERKKYHMKGRYLSSIAEYNLFRGKYNALANNCIHFTRHYIMGQLLTRRKEMRNFASNVQWLVFKWRDMGCRRGPIELAKFLSSILGLPRPFSVTPDHGAQMMVKLLSIYLNIDYNPVLDKKMLDDGKSADEALEETHESDEAAKEEVAKLPKDPRALPIPEITEEEEKDKE